MKSLYLRFVSLVIQMLILNIFTSNSFSKTLTEKDKIDILISHENYKQALENIKQLLCSDSLDPELFYRKGLTEQFLYQNINAIKSFDKALSLDTNNASYNYAKARSLSILGYNNEALYNYKIALKKDSSNISGALSYSSYLISLEMFDEAREIYQSLLKYDSLNINLYSKIAFCYLKVDSLNLAVENYKKAIDLNEVDLKDVQQLVVLFLGSNKVSQADSILNIYITKFPKVPCLIRLKGDVFFKKDEFLDAVKYYTDAINQGDVANYVFPKIALSYFFYANQNDSISYDDKTIFYEKAKTAFETYLVKEEPNPFITHYLGIIYSKLGEYDKAVSNLNKSLEASIPSFTPGTYTYLGECYRIMKNYDSAVVAYKMSLSLNADNEPIIRNLAALYKEILNDDIGLQSYFNEFLIANKDNVLNEDVKDWLKKLLTDTKIKIPKKSTDTSEKK